MEPGEGRVNTDGERDVLQKQNQFFIRHLCC